MPRDTIKSSFYTTRDAIDRLRALALACDLTAKTGHGANRDGSLSLLFAVLADGYSRRPDAVVQFISALAALKETP